MKRQRCTASVRAFSRTTLAPMSRVVQIHLHVGAPPAGADDLDPFVGELAECGEARRCWLEDVDPIERPAWVAHFGQRLAEVRPDIEHDPPRHGPMLAEAAAAAALACGVARVEHAGRPYPGADDGVIAAVSTAAERAWSVTVVIPAADAESSLGVTLDALTTLDIPRGGRTTSSCPMTARRTGRSRSPAGTSRWCVWSAVRCSRPARNRGAATATGDVLAFVDSGDVPCDGWLRQIVETFRDPSVGLASWPAWLIDEAHDRERLNRPGPGVTGVAALATCFAMRRQVFDAVTGYDIALRCGGTPICANEPLLTASTPGTASPRQNGPHASSSAGHPPTTTERDSMLRSTCSCAMPSSSLRIAQDWCSCARSRPSMRPAVGSGRGAGPRGPRCGGAGVCATS